MARVFVPIARKAVTVRTKHGARMSTRFPRTSTSALLRTTYPKTFIYTDSRQTRNGWVRPEGETAFSTAKTGGIP